MFADTEGSHLWAAQLSDESRLSEWEQRLEQARQDGPGRPSLVGYNVMLAAINGLRNDLRYIHRLPQLYGPRTPRDYIDERRRAVSNVRIDTVLGAT